MREDETETIEIMKETENIEMDIMKVLNTQEEITLNTSMMKIHYFIQSLYLMIMSRRIEMNQGIA